ncbi:thioesterase [Intestinibacillus massiliensis]|uniref:thioesterase family protein n=1 Tax=Intestinibacillus massiliensis TaxID=1871029 RepID=UPI000B3544E7|nr:thioesterase [Intestinibacillus massiliensis]MCB6366099.1 thioesterase [Intestinibacillus massiliensis]
MIETGIKGTKEITVTEAMLASSVGSGLVRVYATPMMIAGLEGTAAESVQPFVGEGKTSVGTHMDVTHEAATPAGMKVRFETELTAVSPNGKMLTFRVAAYDEAGLIGQGTHERAVVSLGRFEQKAQDKLG